MNWLLFDPTPIEIRWVDLVVLPFIVSVFVLGYWLGRRVTIQRHVDAVLRRETRLRHPAGRERTGAAPAPLPAPPPPPPPPPMSEHESARFREAWLSTRAAVRSAGIERLCGKPVHNPPVGDWPCVDVAGHDGPCR